MEKRTILQITNVNKLNNLKKNASINDCLKCILEQDFKYNKFIKPDTIELLKASYKDFKMSFNEEFFFVDKKKLDISYQLKCGYYILKYLAKYLDRDLCNYFFDDTDNFGKISKNINVEVTKPGILDNENRFRVDVELVLENGYKIIIEINESSHEDDGKKIKELNRARQILDDDKKICKFFIIREKFIGKNYKNIIYFVKKVLIPFIKKINNLHDEREYVINKLVDLTFESWKPICELIYDSHLNPKEYLVKINRLNNFFNFKWTNEFKNVIDELIKKSYVEGEEECDEEDDDFLSETNIEENDNVEVNEIESEFIEDYYKESNNEVSLTWKGFNCYLTFIIRFIKDIKSTARINKFNYKIHTEFVNIIKEQRDKMIELTETTKIWGYRDNDYSYVIN